MTAANRRKPRRNPGRGRRQPHGGELKTGGTNPGSGRPSNEFRARCVEAMDRIHAIDIATSIAQDTKKAARDRLTALTWLTDRAYGKPTQPSPGEDAETAGGEFRLAFVEARLPDHPRWAELESRLAAALAKHPEAAQAVKTVLAEEASAPEREIDGLTA